VAGFGPLAGHFMSFAFPGAKQRQTVEFCPNWQHSADQLTVNTATIKRFLKEFALFRKK
jgi:hypothetical protein